jgi:hypothetical protein
MEMPDIADLAQIQQEIQTARALKFRQSAGPAVTGYCLNCGEPLPDGRRWCDAACRDEWQRREQILRRNGL